MRSTPAGRRLTMPRRVTCAAGALVLSLVGGVTACSSSDAGASSLPTDTDALVEQAKQEGEVEWAAAKPQKQMQPAIDLFEKKYPGINVKYTETKAPDLSSQLKVQQAARNVSVDVANAVGQTVVSSTTELADDVSWTTFGVDKANVFNSNLVYTWAAPKVWAYNTDKLKASEVPSTWNGLIGSEWSDGSISADSAAQFMSVWSLDESLGQDKAVSWATRFSEQNPHFTSNVNQSEAAVESGQVSMGASLVNLVLAAKAQGAPIALAGTSPTNASEGYLFVPKGAPHPAAAVLLTSFLSSDAAQDVLEKTYNSRIPLTTDCSVAKTNAVVDALCKAGVKWYGTPDLEAYQKQTEFFEATQKALGTLG